MQYLSIFHTWTWTDVCNIYSRQELSSQIIKKRSLSSIHDLKFHRHFDCNYVNFMQASDSLSTTCVLHVYCRIGQRSSCQLNIAILYCNRRLQRTPLNKVSALKGKYSTSTGPTSKQLTLEESPDKSRKWDINDVRAHAVHRKIGEMIVIDDHPFSIVDDSSFVSLLSRRAKV